MSDLKKYKRIIDSSSSSDGLSPSPVKKNGRIISCFYQSALKSPPERNTCQSLRTSSSSSAARSLNFSSSSHNRGAKKQTGQSSFNSISSTTFSGGLDDANSSTPAYPLNVVANKTVNWAMPENVADVEKCNSSSSGEANSGKCVQHYSTFGSFNFV